MPKIPRTVSAISKAADFARKAAATAPQQLPDALQATVQVAIETLERETMGPSWYTVLHPEFEKSYFKKLKAFLVSETKSSTVYPAFTDIYSWSRHVAIQDVKVIIIGQDPYHNVGQAHGLAFSVLPPTKLPGSLKNIYKQLELDVPGFVSPKSGDLTPLAKAGVLCLNTSLTVRAHKAASHAGKGWETFTEQVLRSVVKSKGSNGLVFMAWGLHAQKTLEKIELDETKHLVLKSAHPSPLSAHRGFLGNGHFRTANEWLKQQYGTGYEIDWTVLK